MYLLCCPQEAELKSERLAAQREVRWCVCVGLCHCGHTPVIDPLQLNVEKGKRARLEAMNEEYVETVKGLTYTHSHARSAIDV